MVRKNVCPQCWLLSLVATLTVVLGVSPVPAASPTKYCRFQVAETIAYGIVEGETVRQLKGDLFGTWTKTEKTYPLSDVKLLVPTRPTQVLAMAGNYKSHLGGEAAITTVTTVTTIRTDLATQATATSSQTTTETRNPGQLPEKFAIPQPFFKSPSCLIPHEAEIVLPKDSQSVQYEAEMVIVIGKKAQQVSKESALDYVLGVTCGVDVSERIWQDNDVQWWRAKGSDTFGPCGPYIASGIDYGNLALQLRLNGEVKQQDHTSQLIHDVATMVSTISRYVTLHPGDLIFTGTPGETTDLKPGDVVEVEIEGIGVLRNRVVAGR